MINIILLTRTNNNHSLNMHKEYLDSLLESRLTNYPIKLIVIENNSPIALRNEWYDYITLKYIKYQNIDKSFRYIFQTFDEPFNMNKFYNYGLPFLNKSYPYIMFSNSDLIFKTGWLEECIKVFETKKDAGIVFPSSTIPTYQYNIATENGKKSFSGFRVGPPTNEIIQETGDSCPGWMFLFKRELWQIIDYWDEDFPGWYQDWDMYQTILTLGKKAYYTRNATVDHLEGQTFKPLIEENTTEYHRLTLGKETYLKKWKKTELQKYITF